MLLFMMLISASLFAQYSVNTNNESAPDATTSSLRGTRGAWEVQFNYKGVLSSNSAGCETDGNFFYVTKWNGNLIWKFNMSGVIVDSFTIPGVSKLRDLAYDGTYFYGGAANNSIYKMDFTAHTLVATISSPSVKVRNICYDPVSDAFWVGDWSTNLTLVNRSGVVTKTIPSSTHGLTSTYGTAYDIITPGGPYIWAITANAGINTSIIQINATTGAPTGLTHDCTTDICNVGQIGGGLWIESNVVAGTTTLGGLIQNKSIFGYNLTSAIPDSFDLAVNTINVPMYVPTTGVSIKGEISNEGSVTITSCDLHYKIDGGTTETQNLTSLSIAQYQTYNYTHSTQWIPTEGSHTVEVWVSNPNGHADQNTSNDVMSTNTTGYDPAGVTQRKPLHEVFTSSTCGPCTNGNAHLETILNNYPDKYTVIKYQMRWPGSGDPYYTTEANNRRNYYAINSVPRMEVDGQWDGNAGAYTTTLFDNFYAIPSFIEITATHVVNYHSVDVEVEINPLQNISNSSLKLFVAIVENTTYNNKKTNGETEFHQVMKKMLPGSSGQSVGNLTKGSKVTKNLSYTFKGSYRLPSSASDPINVNTEYSVEEFTDLSVVVWVQDYSTKDVLQSAWSTGTVSSLDENDGNGIIAMFPNPVSSNAFLRYQTNSPEVVNVNIYNMLGKVVYSNNQGVQSNTNTVKLNCEDLNSGIYILKLSIGKKDFLRKFIVE